MVNKKIPRDAFEFYFSLGPGRSYRTVADKYGVSKTAVSDAAKRENWQKRILDLERQANEAMEKRMAETLEEMSERHLKICKLIQRKALESLRSMPLDNALAAARALDTSIKTERLILGEPDRSDLGVEEIIKREYERWLTHEDESHEKPE